MSYTQAISGQRLHAISTMNGWSAAAGTSAIAVAAAASATWPTQNGAIYVPVVVRHRCIIVKLGTMNGAAASGNIDIGVYDMGGSRLVSTGSTAMSGTTTEQVVDVTDTTIGPGCYYLALAVDNTTAAFWRQNFTAPLATAWGVLTQTSAFALPATATFALNHANTYYPGIFALVDTTVS